MDKMTAKQRGQIFGVATKLGIHANDSNDELHMMVERLTGHTSLKDLTTEDASKVLRELARLSGNNQTSYKAPYQKRINQNEAGRQSRPGMITPDQAKMVWRLMYDLEKLDEQPSLVSIGHRLTRIISKELNISSHEKDPFRFITFSQGAQLIEVIKAYIRFEKRKKERKK